MAILQISRITSRKGLTENLPQLAGGEFGWCQDSRRLFIGNGTLQDGAPVIGNTEILTEFSDITVLSDYTYQDIVVGYAAQTGPTPGDPVIRTVQAKLDDMASVRDFGAVGDGVADDTEAINRALFQLYCRENNTQIRRSLFFPAGTYRVTESIIIPTYAKLIGEGADCSIIELDTSSDISSLSAYVARYGDSRQQTGANIGSNGAVSPRNIEISSMTFRSQELTDVFLVECAKDCWFDSVIFQGAVTEDIIIDTGFDPGVYDIGAVRFASTPSLICSDITFDKCLFQTVTFGIKTDQDLRACTVSNSFFDTTWRGIVLEQNVTGFRAVHNMFDNIFSEGVLFEDVSLNLTAYNVFYNVGNSIGSTDPTTPVVRFDCDYNLSIGDMFERSDAQNNEEPRISVTGTYTPSGGTGGLQIGRYSRQTGRTFTLLNNQSNQSIFSVNALDIRAFSMLYTITRANTVRHGTLTVIAGPSDDSTSSTAYTDDYAENFDVGVTLAVTQSTNTVTVTYTTTNTGDNGTLTFSLSNLA